MRAQRLSRSPQPTRWLEALSWNTVIVIGVALVAAVIRFWNFGSLGYQHWDEYFFIDGAVSVSRSWPKGMGYVTWVIAPLVPSTDGTLFRFFGINDWMPLAMSAIYGTLSAVALYFLGSRLFGNAVGLIAAAVLGTAEFSVMYSRMALADATFDFWLIMSVLFIWLGFERRRLVYYVLAGISSGLLLNTKYNGIFPLLLAGSWLGCEFLIDAFRRQKNQPQLMLEYRLRLVGTLVMVGVAIALFMPFLVKVSINPGMRAIVEHLTSTGVNGTTSAHSLIKTPPAFIAWYYWLFTAPPTLFVAAAGIIVGLLRLTRADRLLLIYTAGMFTALMLFPPYPREALSLLPAIAIWTGRAIAETFKALRTRWPRQPVVAMAAAIVCALAVLIGQVANLPDLLSLRTKGYADAGVIAARYQSTGGIIFVRTQSVAFLYLQGAVTIRPSASQEQIFDKRSSRVVFITDQTLGWYPKVQTLFDLNRDRLFVVNRVPNPMYDEVLLQPATEKGLAHLDEPPDAYRYITFWRLTGPLRYPPSWPPP